VEVNVDYCGLDLDGLICRHFAVRYGIADQYSCSSMGCAIWVVTVVDVVVWDFEDTSIGKDTMI
jgi:hypothetical protein